MFHFPVPFCGTEFILQWKGLVDAGAEPVFAFYLEGQVNEKLTISDVNSAHYTGDIALASQQDQIQCH